MCPRRSKDTEIERGNVKEGHQERQGQIERKIELDGGMRYKRD